MSPDVAKPNICSVSIPALPSFHFKILIAFVSLSLLIALRCPLYPPPHYWTATRYGLQTMDHLTIDNGTLHRTIVLIRPFETTHHTILPTDTAKYHHHMMRLTLLLLTLTSIGPTIPYHNIIHVYHEQPSSRRRFLKFNWKILAIKATCWSKNAMAITACISHLSRFTILVTLPSNGALGIFERTQRGSNGVGESSFLIRTSMICLIWLSGGRR